MSVNITLIGGLGNQLFQSACAYAYAKRFNRNLHLSLNSNHGNYFDTILIGLKSYYTTKFHHSDHIHRESGPLKYDQIPDIPGRLNLSGYFQSVKYFLDYKDEVKKLFHQELPEELKVNYHHLLKDVMRGNVVVLHVRRTDYLVHDKVHGPLNPSYYQRAIECMERKLTDESGISLIKIVPFYLLISDDIEFLEELQEKIPVLNQRSQILREHDVNTFLLMQSFKYFIIANSTFSWWGAYLADSQIVIAPKKWFGPDGPKETDDIYLDSWIKM